MRQRFQLVLILAIATSCCAQVVDRMVAVVNRRVILASELDQAVRTEFLMQGKPMDKLTPADNAAVLEHLIDRSLLDQQMVNTSLLDPTAEELRAKLSELRASIPGAAGRGDDGWKSILTSYGLTQQDVEEQLTAQIRTIRFIDLRFRGLVRVDKEAVSAYYQDQFLPELRKRNAAAPQLAEVSDKIEQILVEQRIDALLTDWLKTLRAQAHIERMLPAPPATAAGATP